MHLQKRIKQACLAAVLTICLFFIAASTGLAQNGSWTTVALIPTPRYAAAASAVDGIIYVMGGHTKASYPNPVATVEAYDPATDTWTTKADMPTPRQSLAACTVNGKIYAIGGDNSPNLMGDVVSTVEEYDPETDTWQPRKSMPIAQAYFDGCVLNGKIYVAGGGGVRGSGAVRTVYEFDPIADTWERKESLPSPRSHLALCSLDGYIYAMGGAVNASIDELSLNEAYDPTTDSWTSRTNMRNARYELTACSIDGKIYAIGGGLDGSAYHKSNAVEAYDPLLDRWAIMTSMPTPRFWHAMGNVDGKIYVIGGTTYINADGIVATVEAYDPSLDLGVFLEDISIDKSYAVPGGDSVCVSMKLNNDPAGLSVYAEIQAPDQSPIDKLPLYDDGVHNDGQAGDNRYANVWPVLSAEEQQYFVDVRVTKVETDTVFQHMDNMATFTTIGPLVYVGHSLDPPGFSPGEEVNLELTLKNTGSSTTATNIRAELTCLDSSITLNGSRRAFKDIAPGASMKSSGYYRLTVSDTYAPGTAIPFRIDISSSDSIFWSDTFSILETNVPHEQNNMPQAFALHQNYPNPFNPTTTISYTLSQAGHVTVAIYNLAGRHIRTLIDQEHNAGVYSTIWDAADENGNQVSSGVYLYRIEYKNLVKGREARCAARKMVVMR